MLLDSLGVGLPAKATQINESGITGGGFANDIAIDPNNASGLITAGDVSGVHRSGNGATNSITNNEDMTDQLQLTIASVAYSTANPGVVYAGWGEPCVQMRGGFMKGVPGATGQLQWTDQSSSTSVMFAGQSGSCEGPMAADGTGVRSTGSLRSECWEHCGSEGMVHG